MEKQINKEQAIDLVVEFWAEKLGGKKELHANEPNSNIQLFAILADATTKRATEKQITLFKEKLKEKVKEKLNHGDLDIYCDYEPAAILVEAAMESEIEVTVTTFGFKTGTDIGDDYLYLGGEKYNIK